MIIGWRTTSTLQSGKQPAFCPGRSPSHPEQARLAPPRTTGFPKRHRIRGSGRIVSPGPFPHGVQQVGAWPSFARWSDGQMARLPWFPLTKLSVPMAIPVDPFAKRRVEAPFHQCFYAFVFADPTRAGGLGPPDAQWNTPEH